jgi:DASS family divalent anion:Na+ symporter
MPSTTARAGGVFVPIINSLDKRTQAYLTSQQLQGGNNTSSILLTAAAQNFLCIKLAEQAGVVFSNPFSQWWVR